MGQIQHTTTHTSLLILASPPSSKPAPGVHTPLPPAFPPFLLRLHYPLVHLFLLLPPSLLSVFVVGVREGRLDWLVAWAHS